MGIAKFYRYTSERYPCLNELVTGYEVTDFDNMYLDMNGIFHLTSHAENTDMPYQISEEKLFEDIFHYIGALFGIIKPKKLFFMAVDGVPPRAKMNQNRKGSFCRARDNGELKNQACDNGERLSTQNCIESHSITPGTLFMARLLKHLRSFIKKKISTDPLWAGCNVILSGHETPGEGEHKIMDYIRWARSQEGYDPNTRHCLYGLDADLIMLGICTHNPHFALLREEVTFERNSQMKTNPEEVNFFLLHLSLLREYLEQEFISLKKKLPFEYDFEKILDDWVLMVFLLGNDFLLCLPNLDIMQNDALPVLYKTYLKVLPTFDGYMNEAGNLHLGRFEVFMQELGKLDMQAFRKTYANIQSFEDNTRGRPNGNMEEAEDNMNELFVLHKRDYYMNKLKFAEVTEEVLISQAECYVRAVQWNLHYYYRGCVSWSWFYPHHYPPYISDIKGFKDMKLVYELGTPLKPFEQLLAILPPTCMELLPAPFHKLMVSEDSPIIQYFSLDFETDLNGKKNDWEAVILVPFLDEKKLLSAMEPCYAQLSAEERQRNTHGPMLMYTHYRERLESHVLEKEIWREELFVAEQNLKIGRLPNALGHIFFPGFPTMRHLKYHSRMVKCCVKVFDHLSFNENMIIILESRDSEKASGELEREQELERAAEELLGRVVWVEWPHLTQAKVISVSNEQLRYHHTPDNEAGDSAVNISTMKNVTEERNLGDEWDLQRKNILNHTMGRMGIDVGEVKVIVHAVNLRGHKYVMEKNASFVVEAEWCTVPCGYALQAVVRDLAAHSIPALTRLPVLTMEDAFPPDQLVFVMSGAHYGCQAKVISSGEAAQTGNIEVLVSEATEPNISSAVRKGPYSSYITIGKVAEKCGLSYRLVKSITRSAFIILGEKGTSDGSSKSRIGLDLFSRKDLEVSGYTHRNESHKWLYSPRCSELLLSYIERFPDMFRRMSTLQDADYCFYESELWPDQVGAGKPKEVVAWVKQQAHIFAKKRGCGSEILEGDDLASLAGSVDSQLPNLDNDKRLSLQVKIHLLYKPDLHKGNLPPDPEADFQLYDRVVNVNDAIEVPLGAKGTIAGIFRQPSLNSVRLSDKLNVETTYLVLFDVAFAGGLVEDGVEGTRFYRLGSSSMLDISYGQNLRADIGKESRNEYWDWWRNQNPLCQLTQIQCEQPCQKDQNQQDGGSIALGTDNGPNSASATSTRLNSGSMPQNFNQKNHHKRGQSTNKKPKQQPNWRSDVQATNDGADPAPATFTTSRKERKQFKLCNVGQPAAQDKSNVAQHNSDVAPADNVASTSGQPPAKVFGSNWRRDSQESPHTLPHPSNLTHPPHAFTLPLHPPHADQPYQPRLPVYRSVQQPGLLGPGPRPAVGPSFGPIVGAGHSLDPGRGPLVGPRLASRPGVGPRLGPGPGVGPGLVSGPGAVPRLGPGAGVGPGRGSEPGVGPWLGPGPAVNPILGAGPGVRSVLGDGTGLGPRPCAPFPSRTDTRPDNNKEQQTSDKGGCAED